MFPSRNLKGPHVPTLVTSEDIAGLNPFLVRQSQHLGSQGTAGLQFYQCPIGFFQRVDLDLRNDLAAGSFINDRRFHDLVKR